MADVLCPHSPARATSTAATTTTLRRLLLLLLLNHRRQVVQTASHDSPAIRCCRHCCRGCRYCTAPNGTIRRTVAVSGGGGGGSGAAVVDAGRNHRCLGDGCGRGSGNTGPDGGAGTVDDDGREGGSCLPQMRRTFLKKPFLRGTFCKTAIMRRSCRHLSQMRGTSFLEVTNEWIHKWKVTNEKRTNLTRDNPE